MYIDNIYLQLKMDWVNPLIKVNNKFKFQLFGRNYDNLIHLYTNIPKYDPHYSNAMTQHAFNLFLNASGVFLSTQEIRTVKDSYPHELGISYRQFIDNIRNDITAKRLAAIDHTFLSLSSDGQISVDALISNINAQKHPHVRSLSKQGQKVKKQIQAGVRYWSNNGKTLSHQQFTNYFKDANACIPLQRQQFFVDLLIHTFGLFDNAVSNQRLLQMEITVFESVRQRTYIKKDEGIRSNQAFKFLDLQQKGLVDLQRFVGVLDRIGCRFTDKECKALFYKHSGGSNLLAYQSLIGLLFHMGSGLKDNVNPVFELAKNKQGAITTPGMTKSLT